MVVRVREHSGMVCRQYVLALVTVTLGQAPVVCDIFSILITSYKREGLFPIVLRG